MNKILWFCAGALLMVAPMLSAAEKADSTGPSDQVVADFYGKLAEDINQAQGKVDVVIKEADDPAKMNMVEWLARLREAVFMLKVKFFIAWDFRGTPLINSSVVRAKVLEVMAKDDVQESDINELQMLVEKEKAHLDQGHEVNIEHDNLSVPQ